MRKIFVIMAATLVFAGCCGKAAKQQESAVVSAEQEQVEQQNVENKMIRLNVFVTTTPENLAEVVAGLNEVAAASQKEAGCIGYDIFQNTVEPTKLIIVETWESDAALTAHQQTPHYTTILPPLRDKMSMKLERFDY